MNMDTNKYCAYRFGLVLILSIIGILLFGCILQPQQTNQTNITTTNISKNVTIHNATFFNQSLAVDLSEFIKAGCVKEGSHLNCSGAGLEEKFSCETIQEADNLGGLTPNVPIVACAFKKKDQNEPGGISRLGCLMPIYNKYIILDKGEFKAINTKEEFIQFFAPVETPAEALGFAVALTSSHASYDTHIPENYTAFVSEIEPTYVEDINGSFKVHLFDQQVCGCGNHSYYSIDYLVTNDGNGTIIGSQKLYENPSLAGMCID